ncbi:MAG: aspartate kinase [candidate division WOR-3 bacterium]
MNIIVQKFGGSVIKDFKTIEKIAQIITRTVNNNTRVVVVVSAMGDTTDKLLHIAHQINPLPPGRELDMLLTCGERITMSLLALAINRLGYNAISFTGSQVGIITNEQHTDAKIVDIRGTRLKQALNKGKIPIIAGFQGMSLNREITTLGRGGSDVTAVAIASFLKASYCELYKDVPGVFTENPKFFRNVKHIPLISYQEMTELASSGSEIIHPRACALAFKYNIPIIIKSLSKRGLSTMISKDSYNLKPITKEYTEKAFVRAITHSYNLSRFSLVAVPQLPKCLHQVIVRLATAKIPLLFFAHGAPYQKKFDLSFIIEDKDYQRAKKTLTEASKIIGAEKLLIARKLASISLIGPNIGSDVEIVSRLFETFHKLKIHIDAFSSSEMKITCYLPGKKVKAAVRALLKKFNLLNKK